MRAPLLHWRACDPTQLTWRLAGAPSTSRLSRRHRLLAVNYRRESVSSDSDRLLPGARGGMAIAEHTPERISRKPVRIWASPSPWAGRVQCRQRAICHREVFRWLAHHNIRRRHPRCRYSSPATYENNHTTTTLPEAAKPQIPSPPHGASPCGAAPTESRFAHQLRSRSPPSLPSRLPHGQD